MEWLLIFYQAVALLAFFILFIGVIVTPVEASPTEMAVILILVPLAWPILLVTCLIRYMKYGHT